MKMRKMRWWYDFRKYWDWGRCSLRSGDDLGKERGAQGHTTKFSRLLSIALSGRSSPTFLSFLFEPFVFSLTRSGEKVRGFFRSTEVFTATFLLLRVSSPPIVPLAFTRVSDSRLGQALRYCGLLCRKGPIRQSVCPFVWRFHGIHPFWHLPWPSIGPRMNCLFH